MISLWDFYVRWSCFFAWPALIKRPWQNCLLPRNEKDCSYPKKLCSGFKSPKKFPWDDKSFFRIVSRIVPFVILNSRNMFDEPNSSGIDWWGGGLLSSCPIKNQWNCRLFNILTCFIKSYKEFLLRIASKVLVSQQYLSSKTGLIYLNYVHVHVQFWATNWCFSWLWMVKMKSYMLRINVGRHF